MSNELEPERRPGTSSENLLVLLLGAALFTAGAAMVSYAIFESVVASARFLAQPTHD